MKAFLSWSGERSRAIAEALRDWLPDVIHGLEFWMSAADIEAGTRWRETIEAQLEKSDFGIICLTPENATSNWIHFEAGAISKLVKESRVCVYLHELRPSDLSGPLVAFQANQVSKEGTFSIVQSLNAVADTAKLTPDRLARVFDRSWDDLEKVLSQVPEESEETPIQSRSPEDMLAEILEVVRGQAWMPYLPQMGYHYVGPISVLPGTTNIVNLPDPIQPVRLHDVHMARPCSGENVQKGDEP